MKKQEVVAILLLGCLATPAMSQLQPSQDRAKHPDEHYTNSNGDKSIAPYQNFSIPWVGILEPIPPINFQEISTFPDQKPSNAEPSQHNDEGPKWTDVVVAVFTIVLAGVAYFQWKALLAQEGRLKESIDKAEIASTLQSVDMKESLKIAQQSADAARDSVNTAKEAMIVTRRPWIRADLAIAGSIYFNDNGLNIDLTIRLLNVGPTPAVATSISVKDYVLMRHDFRQAGRPVEGFDLLASQKDFADKNMGETPYGRGEAIFPFIPLERRQIVVNPGFRIPADGNLDAVDFADETFVIMVFGSVAYKAAFHGSIYRTGFIYDILLNDPFDRRITPRRGAIPGECLIVRKVEDGYTD